MIELPFSFPYYGGVKTHIKVSSNGYLTFSGDHYSYGDTSAIPSTVPPNDFIAPYWTDLNPEAGGDIYYYHYEHTLGGQGMGAAGTFTSDDLSVESSRTKFVVQWNAVPYYCTGAVCPAVTFQVLLYPSGAIKFQYQNMEPNPNIHGRPVIGIENGEGDAGIMMSNPPEGALNDPNFVGAGAVGGARLAYYVPRPCEVRDCGAGSWRVEVFRGDDFTLPASSSCRTFEESGFLATSLACGGWMTQSLGWHRIIEPCWCPAALQSYAGGGVGRRRVQGDAAGNPWCAYTGDGECDETSFCEAGTDPQDCCDGTQVKLWPASSAPFHVPGTPVSNDADCSANTLPAAVTPAGDDSCTLFNNSVCNEPYECQVGTDSTDCTIAGVSANQYCQYTGDGECDEIIYCPPGSDSLDCCENGAPRPADSIGRTIVASDVCCGICPVPPLNNWCEYADDGTCDEPIVGTGSCPPSSDATDCTQSQDQCVDSAGQSMTADGHCDEVDLRGCGGMCCPAGTDTADCCDPSTGRAKVDSTGTPVSDDADCPMTPQVMVVTPVVDIIASSLTGLTGHTTYRLSLALSAEAGNVYTIFGLNGHEMFFPAAFNVATAPWGADIGGVNPLLWPVSPVESQWDSWLTVTAVDGLAGIASVGIDFSTWDTAELRTIDGAVFWMDPGSAPVVDTAVIAQLTLPQGMRMRASINAQGRGPLGVIGDDWQQFDIEFRESESVAPVAPAGPGSVIGPVSDPCDYFSAIFTTTMIAETSGRYTFFEASHYSSSVFVDGNQLTRLGCVYRDGQCSENMFSVGLQAGEHGVVVKFVETTGGAFSHVWWQYVGGDCDYQHGSYTAADWVAADTIVAAQEFAGLKDDDYVDVTLPFTFPFYSGQKTSARISTNGYLTFSGAHFSYGDTHPIPDVSAPNDMIAPYWTDLNPEGTLLNLAGASIFVYSTAAEFVVLWKEYPLWGTDSSATFEVIMTPDGGIRFLYEDIPFQMLDYAQPSVGLENSDGTQGLRISYGDLRFPESGMSVSIPVSCEHPAVENGASEGARACEDDRGVVGWSMEVYEGVDFMRGDGSSALVSATCLTATAAASSTSDYSHSDPASGFITADSNCPTGTCPDSWQNDGDCDTEWAPTICPPGTDTEDCGDQAATGCWCPAALHHYNNALPANAPPDWVPVATAVVCSTFGAIYTRILTIQTAGLYRFTQASPDEVAIFIDGVHLHRSGCVLDSKASADHLTNLEYAMECSDASTFDVELTAQDHTLVLNLVHHQDSMTSPPTLKWEFLGTAPCEWSIVGYQWQDAFTNGVQILGAADPALGSLPASFAEAYTLSGCADAARCGTFRRVAASCASGDGCPGGSQEFSGSTDPSMCHGVPVYQKGGGDGPVLYRYENSDGRTQWIVGASTYALENCGIAIAHTSYYSMYLSSPWSDQPGGAPPTAPAYSTGANGSGGTGWEEAASQRSPMCESDCGIAITAEGGATQPPLSAAGVNQQLPLSWTDGFPFFSGQRRDINVFADGFLSFQTDQPVGDGSTQALPSPVEPNNIIAPWWVDLDLSAGGGVYVYEPADSSFWAVEWHDVPYFGSGITVDFEAVLREDGSITFSYKNLTAGPVSHSWAPPSIGLENVAGTDGLRIAYDPDPSLVLAAPDPATNTPGVLGMPSPLSTVEIPTACATEQCGPEQWVVAVYSDLAFGTPLHTTCEDYSQGVEGTPVCITATGQTSPICMDDFCPVDRLPDGKCPAYSAYFIQHVRFERSGLYRFTETSPHSVGILFINDQQVVSSRTETTPHEIDVRLAAGTYEVMYGMIHRPAVQDTAVPVSLSWVSHSHGNCDWSSSDDDDDASGGGDDGIGGGAVPFAWVDLSTRGICEVGSDARCPPTLAMGDDGFVDVALPVAIFPHGFPFFGGHKTAARIGANGYLTFSGEHLTFGDTQAIPSSAVPNDLIAVYWTDLDPSAGGSIFTFADAAQGRWIAQWHEIPLWGQPDAAAPTATFQVMLYPSGEIRMQYLSTPRSTRDGDDVRSSPAVGIENVDGTYGEQIAWHDTAFPVANTAITIPAECEIGSGSGTCPANNWQVRVFHDLHFQMAVQEKCEHWRYDGQLQTCAGTLTELQATSVGCWCPAGLSRYAGEAYQAGAGQAPGDCVYANDNECDDDTGTGLCAAGTDLNDCDPGNTGCSGDTDGFSAILSTIAAVPSDSHGNYIFAALFGARSVATVIIDDDVAFVWDARLETSTACSGTQAADSDGNGDFSCAAIAAFVISGLRADCPTSDGCAFSASPPATLQTFDWHLTEGDHSIVVEYVEEAGKDSGGSAYLTWVRA